MIKDDKKKRRFDLRRGLRRELDLGVHDVLKMVEKFIGHKLDQVSQSVHLKVSFTSTHISI
jgi:hypothetical protein